MLQDCDDEDMSERLQMVHAEINRLTGRLNDLLAFSRHTPEEAKNIDKLTLETLNILNLDYHKIYGDRSAIEKIILLIEDLETL